MMRALASGSASGYFSLRLAAIFSSDLHLLDIFYPGSIMVDSA